MLLQHIAISCFMRIYQSAMSWQCGGWKITDAQPSMWAVMWGEFQFLLRRIYTQWQNGHGSWDYAGAIRRFTWQWPRTLLSSQTRASFSTRHYFINHFRHKRKIDQFMNYPLSTISSVFGETQCLTHSLSFEIIMPSCSCIFAGRICGCHGSQRNSAGDEESQD